MARYRALQDIDIGARWPYAQAGSILQDGEGGNIPSGWVPPAAVDPLDSGAVFVFWNAGVQLLGAVISRWTLQTVAPPVTYWTPYPAGGGTRPYILTGLGAGLGFRNWIETRGANP